MISNKSDQVKDKAENKYHTARANLARSLRTNWKLLISVLLFIIIVLVWLVLTVNPSKESVPEKMERDSLQAVDSAKAL